MTTALEIITGALKRSGSYSPGESLAAADSADALETLNDMLDSWSTDQASVYASSENTFTFVPGQYQYTIGNYTSATTFAGTITSGSAVITGVTVPTDIVASLTTANGSDLSSSTIGIPAGTTVRSTGVNTITMSATATTTPGTPIQITYSIPGNFKTQRPLRITNSFTRIQTQSSGLDYPIEVISQDRYIEIGYKNIPSPWPTAVWYNPTVPLGNLYFYQSPSAAGELHLFADTILTAFTSLTANVMLPQGYVRALKWCLCRELCSVNRYPITPLIERLAKESYDMIKSLNSVPVPVARYDDILNKANRTDYSWIMSGGFR